MLDHNQQATQPRDYAMAMAGLGCAVLPIGAGLKHPPFREWQHLATDDPSTLESWFGDHPEWGVGWKMGRQPDGRYLVAIDVDADKGGLVSMRAFATEHDLYGEFAGTTQAVTGGGGRHFIFEIDPERVTLTNRAKLLPGIDVRSEAGQIVCSPTIHPDTGKRYAWRLAPWDTPPSVASDALVAALASLVTAPVLAAVPDQRPIVTAPAGRDELSPAGWVRANLDWHTYLTKWGWQHISGELWKRPGKTDRGHSAVLHNHGDGPLVVFTTEIPGELEQLGRPTHGQEGISLSLFSFIAAYEFGGDERAYGRYIAEMHLRDARPAWMTSASLRAAAGEADAPSAEYLSDGFWDALPVLSQIRQAARATGMAPDSVFANVLAMWATIIPPSYRLPGVIGTPASLNYLCCVVGDSGVGKTESYNVARELITSRDKAIRFGAVPGSGEGLIKAYLEQVDAVDPETDKKCKVVTQRYRGIHWNVDEGKALATTAGRENSTILPTLTSAWSGSALGQENAQSETWRRLESHSYRLAATIGVQTDNAHLFHTAAMQTLGVTGRIQFAWAHDVAAPRIRPEHPGPIELPMVPDIITGVILTYPDYVVAQIEDEHFGILTRQRQTTLIESQYTLLRCKIAGLLALLTGTRGVSDLTWQLSGEVISCSRSIIHRLEAEHTVKFQRNLTERGHNQAVVELAVEDRKDLVAIDKLSNRIVETILGDSTKRWSRGKLARALTASSTRHRFEPALQRALSSGRVVMDGEFVTKP